MPITTLSSLEFNHTTGRAKKAAANGPVFITDCGKQAYELLSIEAYHRLTGKEKNIIDLLSMPQLADLDIELEIPPRMEYAKPIDLILRLLLDTNVVSAFRKIGIGKDDSAVALWAKSLITPDLFISAVTVYEVELGIVQTLRRYPRQGASTGNGSRRG